MKIKHMAAAFVTAVFLFTGCSGIGSTTRSYTYSVETGDSVKITLDTSDDYEITSDLPFVISKDGETLSQGTFITASAYQEYVGTIENQEGVQLLDSGTKDGIEYIFWSDQDAEYDYAILIEESETGIILGNNVSEDSAKECFERLHFEIKK